MSETSAIVYKGKQPQWNITEITAFPIELSQKSKSIPVRVYLSPYAADELKSVLQKEVAGYKREKRDVEIVARDNSIFAPLCDAHFIKLGNASGTPEEQKAWLDKYPELKPSIVEHTFGGLHIDKQDSTDEPEMLDIGADLSGAVKVYQELYDDSTNTTVRVNMVHTHAHPTEGQYRDYKNARRNRFLRKTNLWTVTESHGALDKLYDAVILTVDGVLVNGMPCDGNKANWVSSIPLWHKLWVVDQIFGDLIAKNE